MPNLTASQFVRSNPVPVGASINVHSGYKSSLLVDGAYEYLRSGEFVPYQAKYATAAARGLRLASFGGYAFPSGAGRQDMSANSSSYPEYFETFAKGKYGKLARVYLDSNSIQVNSNVAAAYGGNELYTFSSLDGTIGTDSNPVLIKTPDYNEIQSTPSNSWSPVTTRLISTPFYLHHLNVWGVIVIGVQNSTSGQACPIYLYTSKNGTEWVQSPGILCVTSSAFTSGNYVMGAGVSEGIVIYIKDGTSSYAQYNKVLANGTVDSTGVVYSGLNKATSTPVLVSAITSELAYFIETESSATRLVMYRGNNATVLISTPTTPPGRVAFAGNGTSFVVLAQQTSVASNNYYYFSDIVNNPNSFTNSTVSTNNDTGAINPYACWTGAYYLLQYSKNVPNTNHVAKVSSGGTFTELAGTITYDSAYSLTSQYNLGAIYKNHLYIGRAGTASRVLDLISFTESATLPVSDIAGYRYTLGYYTDFCYAGTNIVAASAAGLSILESNLTVADLKYWDNTAGPLTSTDISKGRKLKVLNGVIFVTGTSNTSNTLLYSTNNGASWTTNTISQLSNIRDVEFDTATGRYIVVGGFNTANVVYGTTIGTWTPVNASSGVSFNRIFKCGTAFVAYTTANTVRRSTDGGATWTSANPTGLTATGLTSVAAVSNGTTTHIYHSSGSTTAGTCTRYTSTDDGANWSPTTVNVDYPNMVPYEFVQLGSTWYCKLGITTTGLAVALYSTTDFTNFTQIVATWPYLKDTTTLTGKPGTLLTYNNKVVFLCGQNYGGKGAITVYVVDSTDATSYVGTLDEISGQGTHGYIRIR